MKSIFSFLSLFVSLSLAACSPQTPDKPDAPQIVVVGVDGAEWSIMEPMIAAGRLPNFARLMANGSYGTLETLEPILSPIIWTTIATGHSPGKHGITWFMERDAKTGESRPISSRTRKVKALWNIASAANRSVASVGWWATWPAEQVDGWIISDHVATHGFGLRAKDGHTTLGRTYPEDLMTKISPFIVQPSHIPNAEVLDYMDLTPEELATRQGDKLNFKNPLHHFIYALATFKTYEGMSLLALRERDPDLAMFYFEGVDSVSHLFMKYTDPPMKELAPALQAKFKNVVPRFYEEQDRVLGEIMAAARKDAIFVVVSDHGFKSGDKRLSESENTSVRAAHLWHEKNGVVILSGPGIKKGKRIHARVYDIAPTLLYLMGLPYGEDMTGRVILEAITPELLAKRSPTTIPTYEKAKAPKAAGNIDSKDDDTKEKPLANAADIDPDMLARLEALGYMGSGDSTPEVLNNRANIAFREGNYTEAKIALDELLALDSDNQQALNSLVRVLIKLGSLDDAIAIAKQLKPSEGTDPALMLGSLLLEAGKSADAEVQFKALWKKSPDFQIAYRVGLALQEQKHFKEALGWYLKAHKLKPEDAQALNNAGHCSYQLGDEKKATKYFAKAAKASPKHAESRFNLANLALKNKETKKAETWFRESIKARPDFIQARKSLIQLFMNEQRWLDAEKELAIVLRHMPKLGEAWIWRAQVAARLGFKKQAKEYYSEAQKLVPERAAKSLHKDPALERMVR
ncbi:alkaline phosphatase family protein [Myxococcota bacterium]|nr:alkaline phosphatase family protein [Myxococcota bacterium]